MIRLDGVSKRFGRETALSPTDLEIAAGRTTVLVGESGSGKSTLLRLVVGLVAPDAGSVSFAGETVTAATLGGLRRRMGYVIQEGGLFPHLTAEGNATLMARHVGWDAGRITARRDELCALTHLPAALLGRYPGELSGGQRQRVSLMRALFLDPEALLLDEPLGALDAVTRWALARELEQIFTALGKTVVLVTHDLAEAVFFADRLLVLDGGAVVQDGPPRQIVRSPADPRVAALVAAYRETVRAFIEEGE
jgi:osmoprotectant transport system ATP-binding protein